MKTQHIIFIAIFLFNTDAHSTGNDASKRSERGKLLTEKVKRLIKSQKDLYTKPEVFEGLMQFCVPPKKYSKLKDENEHVVIHRYKHKSLNIRMDYYKKSGVFFSKTEYMFSELNLWDWDKSGKLLFKACVDKNNNLLGFIKVNLGKTDKYNRKQNTSILEDEDIYYDGEGNMQKRILLVITAYHKTRTAKFIRRTFDSSNNIVKEKTGDWDYDFIGCPGEEEHCN